VHEPVIDRRRRTLSQAAAVAALMAAAPAIRAQGNPSLTLGIVPYLPAQRLVALYAPLAPVVQSVLERRVDISSARDYATHVQRLRAGAYDVVADSLFLARLAQRELGHVPLVRTQVPLEPLLVVARDGAVQDVAQVRGRTVAVTDRLAALTVLGTRGLRDVGLVVDRDYGLTISGSHANSLHRVLVGDAAAAIVSATTLIQVDPLLVQRVRVLMPLPKGLSAVVYHAAPRWRARAPALTQALLAFAQTEEGRGFIRSLGHGGLVPATDDDLRALDPYVVEYYRLS